MLRQIYFTLGRVLLFFFFLRVLLLKKLTTEVQNSNLYSKDNSYHSENSLRPQKHQVLWEIKSSYLKLYTVLQTFQGTFKHKKNSLQSMVIIYRSNENFGMNYQKGLII